MFNIKPKHQREKQLFLENWKECKLKIPAGNSCAWMLLPGFQFQIKFFELFPFIHIFALISFLSYPPPPSRRRNEE